MKLFALTWIFLLACGTFFTPVVDSTAMAQNYSKTDTTRANHYFELAETWLEEGGQDSAIVWFERAAEAYRDVDEWRGYANSLHRAGETYNEIRAYGEAMPVLQKAAEIAKQHSGGRSLLIHILDNLHRTYRFLGRFEESLDAAFDMYNTAVDLHGSKHKTVADATGRICIAYIAIGQYTEALHYCESSLELLYELKAEPLDIANGTNRMGIIYNSMGRYQRSAEAYRQTLSYMSEGRSTIEDQNIVITMTNLAQVYVQSGAFNLALELLYQVKNELLTFENPSTYLSSVVYSNLGEAYRLMGDYNHAIRYYEEILSIISRFGEQHPYFATIYGLIGGGYHGMEMYEEALSYAGRSLEIREAVFGESHPDIALNLHNLGLTSISSGQLGQAQEHLDKALEIGRSVWDEQNTNIATIHLARARLADALGDRPGAVVQYRLALDVYKKAAGPRHPAIAEIYRELASLSLQNGAFGEALRYIQYGLIANSMTFTDTDAGSNPSPSDALSPREMVRLLGAKAGILAEKLPESEESVLSLYHLMYESIVGLRRSYESDESKIRLGSTIHNLTEQALNVLFSRYEHTGNPSWLHTAFDFSDKARSAILIESIADANAKSYSDIPEELLRQERDLQEQIQYYRMELLKEEHPPDVLNEYRRHHFRLNEQYQSFIAALEENHPGYYELKYSPQSASVQDIQELLNADTAWLQYFQGEEHLFLFVLTKDSAEWLRITDELNREIDTLIRSLRRFDPAGYVNSAPELYDQLVRPAEAFLSGKQNLIILPDERLYYIPFEALLTDIPAPENQMAFSLLPYLLRDFSISYHYSASMYAMAARQNGSSFTLDDTRSIVFGGFAPVFDDGTKLAIPVARRSVLNEDPGRSNTGAEGEVRSLLASSFGPGELTLPPLPHSEDELNTLTALFSGSGLQAVGYLRGMASKHTFLETAGTYTILHIATHGFAEDRHPSLSGIVFSGDGEGTASEVLYAGEMYNLDLNAALVVLSGCETGVGEIARGEGLMAMTRGLIHSGADNILVSLWKVYDEHTKNLMISFYSELLEGQSIPEALRNAKLQMIGNETGAFPGFWSGFVLVGM